MVDGVPPTGNTELDLVVGIVIERIDSIKKEMCGRIHQCEISQRSLWWVVGVVGAALITTFVGHVFLR